MSAVQRPTEARLAQLHREAGGLAISIARHHEVAVLLTAAGWEPRRQLRLIASWLRRVLPYRPSLSCASCSTELTCYDDIRRVALGVPLGAHPPVGIVASLCIGGGDLTEDAIIAEFARLLGMPWVAGGATLTTQPLLTVGEKQR